MNNPMRELRYAIQPTAAQRAARHWRDKNKNHLLQKELAEMIPCSVSCIRECEKESRFPLQASVQRLAMQLYEKHFPAKQNKANAKKR